MVHLYFVPTGTIFHPGIFIGFILNEDPLQILAVVSCISGVGLITTLSSNGALSQLPAIPETATTL